MKSTKKLLLGLLLGVFALTGCATNPVTGKNELTLVSEAQEIAIGNENYLSSRQMQGGDYTVDPGLTAYVNEIGQNLATVSDRKLPYEFKVLNNSVPNAWALPGGKIAINRGLLLELGSESELAAVLGHEIVHAAARHGAKGMERGMLLQGAVLAAGIATQNQNYAQFAVAGAQIAAGLISQKYGRDAERESDQFGMRYMSKAGYDTQGAVDLQRTFVRLSEGRNQSWLEGLFASHPPSPERVRNNTLTAQSLPPGGTSGKERYQQKIAQLTRTKDAYKAYDDGQKALKERQYGKALSLAKEAIAAEPREGQFYALLGDANFEQKRYRDALRDYDRALEKNRDFFYFYLRRGQTHAKLNNTTAARQDLQTSVKLLPTAVANKSLGDLARNAGDLQNAKNYYRTAAESRSALGQEALGELVRLDLADNPGKYLRVRAGVDNKGYLIAAVDNPTPVAVTGIRLAIQFVDGAGQRRVVQRGLRGSVRAGKTRQTQLGLGPFDRETLKTIRIGVAAARAAQ